MPLNCFPFIFAGESTQVTSFVLCNKQNISILLQTTNSDLSVRAIWLSFDHPPRKQMSASYSQIVLCTTNLHLTRKCIMNVFQLHNLCSYNPFTNKTMELLTNCPSLYTVDANGFKYFQLIKHLFHLSRCPKQ